MPVEAFNAPAGDKKRERVWVTEDDGIRHGTTAEALGKVRPAFPQWGGKTTGGNASQITDGAGAVLLMRRSKAEELGLKVLAKWVTTAIVGEQTLLYVGVARPCRLTDSVAGLACFLPSGLQPRIMGIGPSIAIPRVLEMAGITINDVDLFEVNEAFASMMVYCMKTLGLDTEKVNVNGGAIALGHPLDESIHSVLTNGHG